MTLQRVKDAVRRFELENKGISRTVLLKEDQSIDFELLKPFIAEVPEAPFYMSRETFEIFEEAERDIPIYLDKVQRAVDTYIYEHQKKPVIDLDYNQTIDVRRLVHHGYLDEMPPIPFYHTNQEDLITHKKPK